MYLEKTALLPMFSHYKWPQSQHSVLNEFMSSNDRSISAIFKSQSLYQRVNPSRVPLPETVLRRCFPVP